PLVDNFPVTAMLLISARIMKIHLSMLDNGIVPVRNIDGPVRSYGDIHRSERNMICPQYILCKFGGEAAPLLFYCKAVDSIGTEVIGYKTAVPIAQMTT